MILKGQLKKLNKNELCFTQKPSKQIEPVCFVFYIFFDFRFFMYKIKL